MEDIPHTLFQLWQTELFVTYVCCLCVVVCSVVLACQDELFIYSLV